MNQKKAFLALLAYERNCISKYDRPNRPSLPAKQGESMFDFAREYDTTINEMRNQREKVEREIYENPLFINNSLSLHFKQ